MKIKLILLETLEVLRKINPWRINLVDEINEIRRLLNEKFNLIIAGIAADNAAYIHMKKIETIEKILERGGIEKGYEVSRDNIVVEIPRIEVNLSPQRYLIDLTDLIEELENILSRQITKRLETPEIELSSEDLYRYTEEEIKRAENFIVDILKSIKTISFRELCIRAINLNIQPLYVLYAILFIMTEGLIDLIVEEEGYANDFKIRWQDR